MRVFRLSLWPALPALAIAVEWSSYDDSGLGLATACAALVGAGLALGSISRLAGSAVLSDTSLLLMYELTLVVAATVLVVGVVVERSQPTAITDLVVELGAGTRSEALRDALAVAYGDATLQLGYRTGEEYIDAEGKQVFLPAATDGRALTVIEHAGEPIAALVHDAAAVHDPRLDEAV